MYRQQQLQKDEEKLEKEAEEFIFLDVIKVELRFGYVISLGYSRILWISELEYL